MEDVLADDAAVLRELRDRLVRDGATPRSAATFLASWFGGLVASAVGYAWLGSGAAFLVDRAGIRWSLHPDGWTDAVELGDVTAVVAPDHPWAGQPRVLVVDEAADRRARVVDALVEGVRPVIEACHGLARVGKVGLWNEVGDGFASALVYQSAIPVTHAGVVAVGALIAAPGAPWKAQASVRVVSTDHGPVCLMRKGGCCLVFTGAYDHTDGDLDDDYRAYLERFPEQPGAPGYCVTCPRRDVADGEARQLWWAARKDARSEAAGSPV